MGKVPAANTIQEHVQDIPLEYLENMLKEVLKVLENNEVILVMDATGLSTYQYGCWQTIRKSSKKKKRRFVKLHISLDLKSNLILIGFSSKGWKGDHPFGIRMIDKLRGKFKRLGITVEEGIADSGYRSREMATKIGEMGGTPQIKIRSSDTPRKGGSIEWREMVKRQREKPSEFQKSYCYRVVIEGIISALKYIFGPLVRSRKRHNQDVEVLIRLILWNYMHIEPV
ncbi:MAG: transposase [Methanomassiliicoccales archaeon]|nr:MAG: transposase [Methanomassiliicoccales archaeon]